MSTTTASAASVSTGGQGSDTPAPSSLAAAGQRIEFVDVARGTATLLVFAATLATSYHHSAWGRLRAQIGVAAAATFVIVGGRAVGMAHRRALGLSRWRRL